MKKNTYFHKMKSHVIKKGKMLLVFVMMLCLISGCTKKETGSEQQLLKTNQESESITESEEIADNSKEETTTHIDTTTQVSSENGDSQTETNTEQSLGQSETTIESSITMPNSAVTQPITTKPTSAAIQPATTKQAQTVTQSVTTKPTSAATQSATTKPTQAVPQSATTKPTQAVPQSATTKPTQNNQQSTFIPSGSVELDITPTAAAMAKAESIVSSMITAQMDALQRITIIHDYIVTHVTYDTSVSNSTVYTAEGALCNGLAVCQGYAEAFELLCAKAGIQAYMVYGSAISEDNSLIGHAWNIVCIENQWYHVDCTWDDPIINGQVAADASNLRWEYFLLNDSEIYTDHIADKNLSPNLKVCNSQKYVGYGGQMTLNKAMGNPSYIAADASDCYNAAANFINNNIYEFSIAVPLTENMDVNTLSSRIYDTLSATGKGYSASLDYRYSKVWKYTIYTVTATVNWS